MNVQNMYKTIENIIVWPTKNKNKRKTSKEGRHAYGKNKKIISQSKELQKVKNTTQEQIIPLAETRKLRIRND